MFARLLAGLVLGLLMYIPRIPDPDRSKILRPEGPSEDPPSPDTPPSGADEPPTVEIDPPSTGRDHYPSVPPTPPPGYDGAWPPASEGDDGPPAPPSTPPSIFDRIRDAGDGIRKLLRDPDFHKRILMQGAGAVEAKDSAELVAEGDDQTTEA